MRIKNLDKEKVLIDEFKITNASDTYLTLEYIPEQFGLGKNLVKFSVSNFNLIPNSYIDFEAFDSNNEPIQIEYLKTKSNFSRYISLNIIENISSGKGLLIVVLKAKTYPSGVLIDPKINNEYKYNVRYKYPIYVNKFIETESDVYFDVEPTINIKEIIVPNYKSYPEDLIRTNIITGSVQYKVDIDNTPYIYCDNFIINKDIINNGYITFNDITGSFDSSRYYYNSGSDLYNNIPIKKILNINNLTLVKPILLSSITNNLSEYKINTFNSNVTIKYDTNDNIAQPISQSYLNLDIINLDPKTGKVNNFDLYYKASSLTDSTYRYVTTQEIKNNNLLIDKNSNKLNNSIGNIYTQSIIDTYYEIEYNNNLTPPTASIIYDNTKLFDSFKLQYPYTQSLDQYYTIKTKNQYSMSLSKGNYSIEMDLIGEIHTSSSGKPNLICLLSGSGLVQDNVYDGEVIFNLNQELDYKNYGRVKFDFKTEDSVGILKFLYKRGNFYISNIEVKSKTETGANPKSTNINIPLNLDSRFEDIDFKINFNDTKNKTSNIEINKKLINYIGSNTYIDGNDNQLYGSMKLSNDPLKGIEIGGDREGGYIKSNLIYQNSGSLNPSGSGIIMFDYTSGSKFNLDIPDSTINNNVGFDLFAENGDFLQFRAYGSGSGLRLKSADITTGSAPTIAEGLNFLEMPFSFTNINQNSTVALGIGSYIHRVQVKKDVVFDGTSPNMLIRVMGSSPLTIFPTGSIDLKSLDYDLNLDVYKVGSTNAGVINVTINPDGSTTGDGFVYVYFTTDKLT